MAEVTYSINYAGDPNGNRTPNRVNQICFDTTNDEIYRASGLTDTDWVLQSDAGSSTIGALTTYTPTFSWSDGGTGVSYDRQEGTRVYLGDTLAWFSCDIDFTLSSIGSSSNTGNAQFSLPKNSANTNNEITFAQVRLITDAGMDWGGSDHLYANIDPNKSFFTLRTQADGVANIINNGKLVNGRYRLIASGMYACVA